MRVNAAAFLSETAADLAKAAPRRKAYGRRKYGSAFWRTNRSYRFSLPIWQKRNQNFWTGYSKYSRSTTHWALTRRIRRAVYPASCASERQGAPQLGLLFSPGALLVDWSDCGAKPALLTTWRSTVGRAINASADCGCWRAQHPPPGQQAPSPISDSRAGPASSE
jgi:hypothetical protein